MSKTSKEVVTLKGLLPLSFLQHSPHALAIRNNINTIVDVVLCEMVVISNDQQKLGFGLNKIPSPSPQGFLFNPKTVKS